jgi:glycosyltransferase involved in cell wall biosynthesis
MSYALKKQIKKTKLILLLYKQGDFLKQNTALVCFARCLGGLELDTLKTARIFSGVLQLILVISRDSDLAKHKEEFLQLGHLYEEVHFKYNSSISLTFQFRKILLKHDIKNIIFFGSSEMKSIYYSCIGLKLNFIMRHGTTRAYPKNDFYHVWLYKIINIHLAISEHLKKNVIEMVPVAPNAQVVRVYRSVEFPIKITRSESKIIRILHLARIDPGKGQLEALYAALELRKKISNFKLQFVGSVTKGPLFDQLKKFVAQNEMENYVEFVGHTNDVSSYLMSSDLFLFPSWGEGLPNVILEGFAHGIPILAFNNTVFPEFQKLGFHITLAQNRDIEDLKAKLFDIIDNFGHEKNLSLQNIELAKNYFNKKSEVDGLLNLLV